MNKTIKYIDLFAGIGGIRLGLTQALDELGIKHECVMTSEIKPAAIQVYKENFPNAKITGDICKVDVNDIPDFDILLQVSLVNHLVRQENKEVLKTQGELCFLKSPKY